MVNPLEDGASRINSRGGAAAFGLVLLGAAALAGLFAVLPALRGGERLDITAILILALFAPMAVILLVAAWSMLVFAATGRRQRTLPPGPLAVFGVVLAATFCGIAMAAAMRGDWPAVLAAIMTVVLIGGYARHYWRVHQKPRP
jgi:hypothetical protein